MIKTLLALASPAGERARLSIFIFHRVHREIDPLFPRELDAQGFERVCGWIRRWFNVLPLDDAARRLREGMLPSRAAALTFDDGYADNHDVALPVLRRLRMPCTFFIATGFLDGGRMWNDTVIETYRRTRNVSLACGDLVPALGDVVCETVEQRSRAIEATINAVKYLEPSQRQRVVDELARRGGAQLPDDLMMTSEQVRGMRRAGMQIGAHTVNHPILARLDDAAALGEIRDSKCRLESLLDEPVAAFAYPNGKPGEDYLNRTVGLAREAGFETAVSTAWGAASRDTDPLQLPRFTPWDRTPLRFALRSLRNFGVYSTEAAEAISVASR